MAINVPTDVVLAVEEAPSRSWLSGMREFVRRRPLGAIGAAVVVLMIVVAAFAGVLAPYDPVAVDFGAMLARPSALHWLGTDAFGRDVLSRLIFGSRTALFVGFGAAFVGATAAKASSRSRSSSSPWPSSPSSAMRFTTSSLQSRSP